MFALEFAERRRRIEWAASGLEVFEGTTEADQYAQVFDEEFPFFENLEITRIPMPTITKCFVSAVLAGLAEADMQRRSD